MSRRADPWLPIEALARPALMRKVNAVLADWIGCWFSDVELTASRVEAVSGDLWGSLSADGKLRRTVLGVSCSERALGRLVDRALDLESVRVSATEADRRITDTLGNAILDDLLVRLEAELIVAGVDQELRAGRGGAKVGLAGADGGVLIWVGLPTHVALPICKAELPPPKPSAMGLNTMLEAIGSERVALEIVMGAAELSVSDLGTLAVGDVVILDRGLGEPAEILLSNSAVVVGRAALVAADDRAALALQPNES